MMRIGVSAKRARAILTRWLSPPESEQSVPKTLSYPLGSDMMKSSICAVRAASRISSKDASGFAKEMFLPMEALISIGSWSTNETVL